MENVWQRMVISGWNQLLVSGHLFRKLVSGSSIGKGRRSVFEWNILILPSTEKDSIRLFILTCISNTVSGLCRPVNLSGSSWILISLCRTTGSGKWDLILNYFLVRCLANHII